MFEVPPLVNVNPPAAFAVNPHEPPPAPPETVIVHSTVEPGPLTWIEVSVEDRPDTVAVTVTPEGPDVGLSVSPAVVPVNVATAVDPPVSVAVTEFAVPPLLNAKPFAELAANVHDPPPVPPEMLIVQSAVKLGPVIAIEVSADENPDTVAVTVTPLGAREGLSARPVTVPVKVALWLSPAGEALAVTCVAVPELLNANPFEIVGMNEQPLEIAPELTEHRTMLESPGLESLT